MLQAVDDALAVLERVRPPRTLEAPHQGLIRRLQEDGAHVDPVPVAEVVAAAQR